MLDTIDHVASILTALVALVAYGQYQWKRRSKRKLLEDFLRNEHPGKREPNDKGRRTVMHIMAELGMTEADVLDAAFSSRRVKRTPAQNRDTGRAEAIYLEYSN